MAWPEPLTEPRPEPRVRAMMTATNLQTLEPVGIVSARHACVKQHMAIRGQMKSTCQPSQPGLHDMARDASLK